VGVPSPLTRLLVIAKTKGRNAKKWGVWKENDLKNAKTAVIGICGMLLTAVFKKFLTVLAGVFKVRLILKKALL
jgi:hypothetical protein